MNINYGIILILMGILVIVDLFKLKFKIDFQNNGLFWLISGRIFAVAVAYIGFNFGLDVIRCVIESDKQQMCNVTGLDFLLITIGFLFLVGAVFGYALLIFSKVIKEKLPITTSDTSETKKEIEQSSTKPKRYIVDKNGKIRVVK